MLSSDPMPVPGFANSFFTQSDAGFFPLSPSKCELNMYIYKSL